MKQRGKKSAAASEVASNVVDIGNAKRPRPPDCLSADEKKLWREIVSVREVDFFEAGSLPLLEEYCRTWTQLRLLGATLKKHGEAWLSDDAGLKRYAKVEGLWDRAQRRQLALATKMRLAQQNRYVPDHTKGRPKKDGGGAKPWDDEE